MPTYVYKCSLCDKKWEVAHSIHDDQPTIHGDCGMFARRVPQVTGTLLKGDGWAGKKDGHHADRWE